MLEYRLLEKVPHGSSGFPFAVYNVDYCLGNQQILPMHWHKEIELIHIRAGQAVFSVNHSEIPVQAGDCLIINSGEPHSGYSDAETGCSYTAIVFKLSWLSALHPDLCQEQYLNPLLRGEMLFPPLLSGQRAQDRPVINKIEDLLMEYHNGHDGFQLCVKGRLYMLLAALYPKLIPKHLYERSNPLNAHKWKNMLQVLEYIDENYKSPLTLNDLTAIGSISSSHLCRLFKELTDMRPMEYINLLRVNSAALMIQSGSCSMLEAALENGFQHLSYFSKQFRKYKGISPSRFKRLKGNATSPY
ncbi:AraC-like DNA-binding protein [Paenibacillus endophyticus]|uniref:AraC-like DNA-binding protein n=1 Tax=Paenibacillus endophyticus TaxID=1294268 RepID=A0A7W5CCD0_9BACL|nr:AraC family transcriptional regulator [Paenibacillus endophyticus]MBB3155121.1 AraC-like DNA-binding protein [Paenibacillus endophyticus]